MKSSRYLILILFIVFSAFNVREVDKSEFYSAFSGNSEKIINEMIVRLSQEKSSSILLAYQGALLMKKADFEKGAGTKIKTFKSGSRLLESEIAKKPANIEYRFLRLAIQEHAPKILKYNKNLDADKKAVIDGFKSLDPELKRTIKAYSSSSEVIKIDDLQ